MAEVKIEASETQGIKLFGKTIVLRAKVKVEDQATHRPSIHNNEESNSSNESEESSLQKKRPDKIVACPRCKSMDTKFCYFNNYNVNQPRHFCKGCQRYWTAGGALRNVPVGAGRRKTKAGPLPFPAHLPSAADINALFGTGVALVRNDQCLGVDGAVFQEYWPHHQRQRLQATERDGFRPDFLAKRRRINESAGQTNC